jgi:DNA-binding response OmpR family regulator
MASVLILEDDRLIGQMLSELVREAGYQVVGPSASTASARALVAEHGINAALLDIDLGEDGLCFGLATMLQAQHIPIAFLTGYSAQLMPIAFRESPRIGKPFSHEEVLTVVRHLLGAGPSASTTPGHRAIGSR